MLFIDVIEIVQKVAGEYASQRRIAVLVCLPFDEKT
jgi:hypothetical protein